MHWALRQCVIKLDHRRLPKACAPDRSVADNAVARKRPLLPVAQAHPDVETLTTVVAIAYYAARCAGRTRRHLHIGEESEVIGERYAQLAVVAAERLGGDHVSELTSRSEVARAVSVGRAGGGIRKWRDPARASVVDRYHRGRRRTRRRHRATACPVPPAGHVPGVVVVVDAPSGGLRSRQEARRDDAGSLCKQSASLPPRRRLVCNGSRGSRQGIVRDVRPRFGGARQTSSQREHDETRRRAARLAPRTRSSRATYWQRLCGNQVRDS